MRGGGARLKGGGGGGEYGGISFFGYNIPRWTGMSLPALYAYDTGSLKGDKGANMRQSNLYQIALLRKRLL